MTDTPRCEHTADMFSEPSADAADVSQAREQDQQTAQAAGSTQTGERGGS